MGHPVDCGVFSTILASTHEMPVAIPQLEQSKVSPDTAKCLKCRAKLSLAENHCSREMVLHGGEEYGRVITTSCSHSASVSHL